MSRQNPEGEISTMTELMPVPKLLDIDKKIPGFRSNVVHDAPGV